MIASGRAPSPRPSSPPSWRPPCSPCGPPIAAHPSPARARTAARSPRTRRTAPTGSAARHPATRTPATPAPDPTPASPRASDSPDVSVEVISVASGQQKSGLSVEADSSGDTTLITLRASGSSPVRWSAYTEASWLYLEPVVGDAGAGRVVDDQGVRRPSARADRLLERECVRGARGGGGHDRRLRDGGADPVASWAPAGSADAVRSRAGPWSDRPGARSGAHAQRPGAFGSRIPSPRPATSAPSDPEPEPPPESPGGSTPPPSASGSPSDSGDPSLVGGLNASRGGVVVRGSRGLVAQFPAPLVGRPLLAGSARPLRGTAGIAQRAPQPRAGSAGCGATNGSCDARRSSQSSTRRS